LQDQLGLSRRGDVAVEEIGHETTQSRLIIKMGLGTLYTGPVL
jgi:hypothetical protein